MHLPPIPNSRITVSRLILVFYLLFISNTKFVSLQTSNHRHESINQGNEKRFALCLFGKIGNMYEKARRKGHDESSESLMISSPTHFEHLILPNKLDVFAHSWMKGQPHIVKLINDTYSPYLKAQRHGDLTKLMPVQSMMITIWNSLKLMMNYSKEKEINYDLVILMRYDLFFRQTLDLSKLDSEVFWVPVWCETYLGKFKKKKKKKGNRIEGFSQSQSSLFKHIKKPQSKEFMSGGVRDEIFISSPDFLSSFFSSLIESFFFAIPQEKGIAASSGHFYVGRHAINLHLPQNGILRELPGFVCAYQYIISRHYRYLPFFKNGTLVDIDSVKTCSLETHFFKWSPEPLKPTQLLQ